MQFEVSCFRSECLSPKAPEWRGKVDVDGAPHELAIWVSRKDGQVTKLYCRLGPARERTAAPSPAPRPAAPEPPCPAPASPAPAPVAATAADPAILEEIPF